MRKILIISYDPLLLESRRLLLEQAGFIVTSVLGFVEAVTACEQAGNFDLVVIGHSIPQSEKEEFLALIKKTSSPPVLSIALSIDPPLEAADLYVDSQDGPQALLDAVKSITQSKVA